MRRGGEAQRLLRDAIYNEAHTAIRERLVSLLEQDIEPGKRDRVNDDIRALSRVRKYIEQVAMGGKMAAEQIERERTFRERMSDKLRSVA